MNRVVFALCVLFLAANGIVFAESVAKDADYLNADPKSLEWWRQARFGLFLHWGPVSLSGQEISWSRGGVRLGLPTNDPNWGNLANNERTGIPIEEYDNLYKRFDPVKFNARELVALAKAAGMGYIVLTSKHHDGFCMFDSEYTDYDIMAGPYGKDICKQLADACHEAGMRLGWYYSPPDWHHPDYYTDRHYRYIRYLHNQVRELLTNYGKVDIMWFDGLMCTADKLHSDTLYKTIRKLQPGILINNRLALPGDFDTPEQTIGRFQNQRPWESCITIGDQWSWRPNDRTKSLKQCISTLVQCAGGDGNLLFNVGPKSDGSIEPDQVDRLRNMGVWLRKYGESIYGTRGGPFILSHVGASTYSGNKIYIHVLDWQGNVLTLPAIPAKIVRCRALTGGAASCVQDENGIRIDLGKTARNEIDTIIVIELDRPASEIKPVSVASGLLSVDKPAKASNVFRGMKEFGPDKALDGNDGTRWATDDGVSPAWLEVDLAKPQTFRRVIISEALDRVRKFELLCRDSDAQEWRVFHTGTTIGDDLKLDIPLVTARYVRLNIIEAPGGPTVWEFQVQNPPR